MLIHQNFMEKFVKLKTTLFIEQTTTNVKFIHVSMVIIWLIKMFVNKEMIHIYHLEIKEIHTLHLQEDLNYHMPMFHKKYLLLMMKKVKEKKYHIMMILIIQFGILKKVNFGQY